MPVGSPRQLDISQEGLEPSMGEDVVLLSPPPDFAMSTALKGFPKESIRIGLATTVFAI